MNVKQVAQGAVYGPRGKLVDRMQEPIARRLPVSPEAVRTAFGALFLLLAVRTIVRAVRSGRGA